MVPEQTVNIEIPQMEQIVSRKLPERRPIDYDETILRKDVIE
jgi:hypothetical protein